MKIAIPSEEKSLESKVCQSFGRTNYFIVVDDQTLEYEILDNKAISSQGGAGIKAAQQIVDSGAKVVITMHCGQNAADVLKAADVIIYRAIDGSIRELIDKYKKGELNELSEIHAGYHNHGG